MLTFCYAIVLPLERRQNIGLAEKMFCSLSQDELANIVILQLRNVRILFFFFFNFISRGEFYTIGHVTMWHFL